MRDAETLSKGEELRSWCFGGPPPPSRTNWTRLVSPSRTNWTRHQVVFTEVNGKRHEPVEEVPAVPSLNRFTKLPLSAESRTSRRVAGRALLLTGNGSNALPI